MSTSLFCKSRRTAAGRGSRRPEVEVLEDRTVPSVGSPFPISTSARDDNAPVTAGSANGMSVVVWQQDDGSGSGKDNLYAQLFAPNQAPVGLLAVSIHADHDHSPDVSMDAAGNFVVVWARQVGDGNTDVQYARFLSGGNLTDLGAVAAKSTIGEFAPQVAMNAAGKYVVTYTTVDRGDADVLARRYDAGGNQLGRTIKVAARADRREAFSRIDTADKGPFAIVYQSVNPHPPEDRIFLKRYSGNGRLLGTSRILAGATVAGMFSSQDVAVDNKGNCTVVYDDRWSGGDSDILMRRVTARGTVTPRVYLTDSPDNEIHPRIALDCSDGKFALAYTRFSTTEGHTFVGEFSKQGTSWGEHELGACALTLWPGHGVSFDGLNRYFVAYETPFSESDHDIYGRFGALN